jgi:hypothetical protein
VDDVGAEAEHENSEFNLKGLDFSEVFEDLLATFEKETTLPAKERAAVAYVAGFLVRKVVDLSCERCKSLLTVEPSEHNSDHALIEAKERSSRLSLRYPSSQLVLTIGLAAQISDSVLRETPHILSVKDCITTRINDKVDWRWFDCEKHQVVTKQGLISLMCRVNLHHFCKKTNRANKAKKAQLNVSGGAKPTSRQKRIRKVLHQ